MRSSSGFSPGPPAGTARAFVTHDRGHSGILQQAELRLLARERDHHFVAYAPPAKGAVLDVPEPEAVAGNHGATTAQVALAWLIDEDGVVAIPKSDEEANIEETLAATELDLSEEEVWRIDAIDREERAVDGPGTPWRQ